MAKRKASKKKPGGSDTMRRLGWRPMSACLAPADLADLAAAAKGAGLTLQGYLRLAALLAQRGWVPSEADWHLLRSTGVERVSGLAGRADRVPPEVVRAVRRDHFARPKLSQAGIAAKYGLTQRQVSRIVRGESYPEGGATNGEAGP